MAQYNSPLNFGQNLINVALEYQRLAESRRQFAEDSAFRNRQLNLLDLFRQEQLKQGAEENDIARINAQTSRYNAETNRMQEERLRQPAPEEYITKEVTLGDKVYTYELPKGGKISEGKLLGVTPKYKTESGSESIKRPDIGKDIEYLRQLQGDVRALARGEEINDKSGNKLTINALVPQIEGVTDNIINQAEKAEPGFKTVMNHIFSQMEKEGAGKFKKDPKEIEKLISRIMKGNDPYYIDLAKEIAKARYF